MNELKIDTQHCYPLSLRRLLPKPCNFYWKQIQANKRWRPSSTLPLDWAPSSPHGSPIACYLPSAVCEKGDGLSITIINITNYHAQHLQDISPITVHWCAAHRWKPCPFIDLWEEEEGHPSGLSHFFLNAKGVFQVVFCSKHAGPSPANSGCFSSSPVYRNHFSPPAPQMCFCKQQPAP